MMNKKEITIKTSKNAGITVLQAEKAFQTFLEEIKNSLKKGSRVTFSGFGSFEVKIRKARQGRNPKTGETITISQKKTVKFTPSRSLREAL